MDNLYQLKLGKPFYLQEIDRLFYACTFHNSNKSFFIEKEKFALLVNKGLLTTYRKVANI